MTIKDDKRHHLDSMLMRESMVDKKVMASTESPVVRMLPHVHVVKIGARSILESGKEVCYPVVETLTKILEKEKLILSTGGGARSRHVFSIGIDLGLPTGGVAQLVGAMEECNAVFLNALLAGHGSIPMQREHFWDLPLYYNSGLTPIAISVPPYHFWEPPSGEGPIPAHGSDFGLFMHSEVLGMDHVIYLKDEDGLYDKDPKRHTDATLIPKITLAELEKIMPEEVILDRQVFQAWRETRHVKRIQIINGLVPGNLTRALAGEDVGTVITKE